MVVYPPIIQLCPSHSTSGENVGRGWRAACERCQESSGHSSVVAVDRGLVLADGTGLSEFAERAVSTSVDMTGRQRGRIRDPCSVQLVDHSILLIVASSP